MVRSLVLKCYFASLKYSKNQFWIGSEIQFFYGLIIDESINVSVIGHVIFFATFVKEEIPITTFLSLLVIHGGKKKHKVKSIEEWGLDMQKCVGY